MKNEDKIFSKYDKITNTIEEVRSEKDTLQDWLFLKKDNYSVTISRDNLELLLKEARFLGYRSGMEFVIARVA